MVKCWICGRSPSAVLKALLTAAELMPIVTEEQAVRFGKKFGKFITSPDGETEIEVACCPVCENIIREQAFDEVEKEFDELWEGFAEKKRFVLRVNEASG